MGSKLLSLGVFSELRPVDIPSTGIDKVSLYNPKNITRTTKLFGKAEVSISSYDTAWVAMVPAKDSEDRPMFPECLDWVMQNQHPDGSWCLNPWHPLLVKDSLSSTLACVLALNKWRLGEPFVKRGLYYIETNGWAATDDKQLNPIGFDIIFPAMLQFAIESGLKLYLDMDLVDELLQKRETEIRRCDIEGWREHLPYLLEGIIGRKYDRWKEILKHQLGNGLFLNSPSTAAAVLIHYQNKHCYNYLNSVKKRYHNAVPTVYPLEIYTQLCAIDNLQKLGLDRYCASDIQSALNNIYRYWVQEDEEIFLNTKCCALGFRLLRMNGYDVSSDSLKYFAEEKQFFNSVSPFKSIDTILELFKASQLIIHRREPVLEKLKAWTSSFLKQKLLNGDIQDQKLHNEVDHALRYCYGTLDFLETRRNIELELQDVDKDNIQLLKTSYRIMDNNRDILTLALRNFHDCQAIYRKEFQDLQRWVKDSRLDKFNIATQRLNYCYFSTAAALVAPELAEARIFMTKNCLLTTVVDDLFDVCGSKEELEHMIQLFERWGESAALDSCSEPVEILFSAIHEMIKELEHSALNRHGRSVEHHFVQIWHDLVVSMMKEAEWARESLTPTLDEYMENACTSFALEPILIITLYFLGPTLAEEVMKGPQVYSLYNHVSFVGRLLNDLNSYKREAEQGKYNSVTLRVLHGQGNITEEEAIKETRKDIEKYKRELLQMVVQKKESSLPKAWRDFFWKFSNTLHYFYMDTDGYSCPNEKLKDAKAVLWEPIALPHIYSN